MSRTTRLTKNNCLKISSHIKAGSKYWEEDGTDAYMPNVILGMTVMQDNPPMTPLSLGDATLLSLHPSEVPSPSPNPCTSHAPPSLPFPLLWAPQIPLASIYFPLTPLLPIIPIVFVLWPICLSPILCLFRISGPSVFLMALECCSNLAPNQGCGRARMVSCGDSLGSLPIIHAESFTRNTTLNYGVAVNPETQERIASIEAQARALRRGVPMEEVDADFTWIPDLTLTRA